jgi:hypothetical protein
VNAPARRHELADPVREPLRGGASRWRVGAIRIMVGIHDRQLVERGAGLGLPGPHEMGEAPGPGDLAHRAEPVDRAVRADALPRSEALRDRRHADLRDDGAQVVMTAFAVERQRQAQAAIRLRPDRLPRESPVPVRPAERIREVLAWPFPPARLRRLGAQHIKTFAQIGARESGRLHPRHRGNTDRSLPRGVVPPPAIVLWVTRGFWPAAAFPR